MMRNFHPAELWDGAAGRRPIEFQHLMKSAIDNGVSVRQHHAGEAFDFGSVHFTVLSPPQDWQLKERVRDDTRWYCGPRIAGTHYCWSAMWGRKSSEQC